MGRTPSVACRLSAALWCVVLTSTFAGCGGGSGASGPIRIVAGDSTPGGGSTTPGGMVTPREVPFTVLDRGQHSAHPLATAGGHEVVRNGRAWLQFWSQHRPNSTPPQLDFASEQAIALFLGRSPTSGYGVAVDHVVRLGDALRLHVFEYSPAPGSTQMQVVTRPYEIIGLERTGGTVTLLPYEQLHPEQLERGEISYHRYNDPNFGGSLEVFTDEQPFLRFWNDHVSGRTPTPRPPRVNFAQEMVVAALQGYRPNGGYGIRVVDVHAQRSGERLVVTLEQDEAGGFASVITNPYELVKLPRRPFQRVVVRRNREVPLQAVPGGSGPVSGYRYGDAQFRGELRVVRDDAAWQRLWAQHTANVQPQPAPPTVDFSRQCVIVAWMGHRSTGGYAIAISKVVIDWREDATVTIQRTSPPPGSITTQVITNPVAMVIVPRFGGTVRER